MWPTYQKVAESLIAYGRQVAKSYASGEIPIVTARDKIAVHKTKSHPVSPALSNFIGTKKASRFEVYTKVNNYIIQNGLRNENREIMCDHKLKSIFFGEDKVPPSKVGRLLSRHFPRVRTKKTN